MIRRSYPTILLLLVSLHTAFKITNAFAQRGGARKNRSQITLAAKKVKTEERRPWEALRFLKQSSKFVTLPRLTRSDEKTVVKPGDVIWEPGTKYDWSWSPLDDVVMGGASSSGFDNETGMWTGAVTSANNGGFVGVRTTPFLEALDMKGCKGIELRLRGGNGKTFKAILRDSSDFNGVCWTTSFKTKGAVKLPFAKQVPTVFAKTVPGEMFQPDNVQGLQLTYSKFEYDGGLNPNFALGVFSLQVLKITAY